MSVPEGCALALILEDELKQKAKKARYKESLQHKERQVFGNFLLMKLLSLAQLTLFEFYFEFYLGLRRRVPLELSEDVFHFRPFP